MYDKPQSGYLIPEDIWTQNLWNAKHSINWQSIFKTENILFRIQC